MMELKMLCEIVKSFLTANCLIKNVTVAETYEVYLACRKASLF